MTQIAIKNTFNPTKVLDMPAFIEAETAFKWAIAEARRCHMCLLELFAYVDYIKHVLDPAGRRDEALPGLGACILQMASRPEEFNALLGDGLDAEAAVAVAAPRG